MKWINELRRRISRKHEENAGRNGDLRNFVRHAAEEVEADQISAPAASRGPDPQPKRRQRNKDWCGVPPHEKTLQAYLGIGEHKISDGLKSCRPHGESELAELRRGVVSWLRPDPEYEVIETPETAPQNIEFRKYPKLVNGAAIDTLTGKPVGLISMSIPYCAQTRQGIGSHLVALFIPELLTSVFIRTFSKEGYRSRIAAHGLLVTWALLDGDHVPQEVLDEYRVEDSRPTEAEPPEGGSIPQTVPHTFRATRYRLVHRDILIDKMAKKAGVDISSPDAMEVIRNEVEEMKKASEIVAILRPEPTDPAPDI